MHIDSDKSKQSKDANYARTSPLMAKDRFLDNEVQLLTRDSSEINSESGMVLFAGRNDVTVRHTANKIDYVYRSFGTNLSIDYGEWYVMRFMIHSGTVRAFVNETQVYVSNEAYPVGEYREPHLAVRYTVARFEYVKVFVLSG